MTGSQITIKKGKLKVPNDPIIPFIEGDGTGPDIWAASVRVLDAAVEKAYKGKKKIVWREVLAGEKAFNKTGNWLPDETLEVIKEYKVAIKGPLTTPVGGGIRSLNVALRQQVDLYACVRPVEYFKGVPSPVKEPHLVNMVIFRENTEDIYAGIEYLAGTPEADKVLAFLQTKWVLKKSVSRKHRLSASSLFQKRVLNASFAGTGVCIQTEAQVADARSQRQHHEIYGR